MEEPPCAKSRERVVFFSPLLIVFNTRAGVISPPVPRGERSPTTRTHFGGLEAKIPPHGPPSSSSSSSSLALSSKAESSAEDTVPTRAFPRLTPQKTRGKSK